MEYSLVLLVGECRGTMIMLGKRSLLLAVAVAIGVGHRAVGNLTAFGLINIVCIHGCDGWFGPP